MKLFCVAQLPVISHLLPSLLFARICVGHSQGSLFLPPAAWLSQCVPLVTVPSGSALPPVPFAPARAAYLHWDRVGGYLAPPQINHRPSLCLTASLRGRGVQVGMRLSLSSWRQVHLEERRGKALPSLRRGAREGLIFATCTCFGELLCLGNTAVCPSPPYTFSYS